MDSDNLMWHPAPRHTPVGPLLGAGILPGMNMLSKTLKQSWLLVAFLLVLWSTRQMPPTS